MLRLFKFQQEKIYKDHKRTFIYYYSFDAEFLNQLRGEIVSEVKKSQRIRTRKYVIFVILSQS